MIWSCNRRAGKGIAARVPKVLWSSVGVNNSRTSVHATKPDHHWLFHTHRNPRRHELCAPLPNGRRYSRCGYYHRSLHRPALATAERPYLNPYVTCDCRAATEMMERGMKLVVDVPDRVRRRGLSLHRHGSGGGGGGTGCECENKLSASFQLSAPFPRVAGCLSHGETFILSDRPTAAHQQAVGNRYLVT
jgi:hypothetical protein